eukprot:12081825-Ditylum_brightwellii.AAC.1
MTTPTLVREYGNMRMWSHPASRKNNRSDIVLPKSLKKRLADLSNLTERARDRQARLRNILLHGPPGTGKTMVAKALAASTKDIPYALMSGADLSPLGRKGPSELKRLLSWGSKQRKGGIIIIDEAESALGSRVKNHDLTDDNSPHSASEKGNNLPVEKKLEFANDSLNVLLSMTGDTSGTLMLILTTCNPSALDEAVLDRMDEIIYVPLPQEQERLALLAKEFQRIFYKMEPRKKWFTAPIPRFFKKGNAHQRIPMDNDFDAELSNKKLAKDCMTSGYSGRELCKIINGVANRVYASDKCLLTADIWSRATKQL